MSTLQQLREIITDRITSYQKDDKPKQQGLQILYVEPEPFQNLQKSAVLSESRCFNESQIQDRKCRIILTKFIYLINQGEVFNDKETQQVFFGITKLFQSNNLDLRRIIYLMIKEFRDEKTKYVVISCLTKDIVCTNDLFRLNALRTIPQVQDQSNLVQTERYLKNAILDKSQPISSAALIAGIQIFRMSAEMVRKWANEVSERLNSKYPQNSFHALLLLHEIKKIDHVTFMKILLQLTKETLVPIGNMQVIRFIKEVMPNVDSSYEKQFIEYLLRQIHKSQEIVIFEAAKALCEVKQLSNKDLQPMVQVISVFLVSNSSTNKFVALKLLNKLIANPVRRPLITSTQQIEALIQDSNKSLSSLAVSILLKICQEQNIEKTLTDILEYLTDMSDEFKIDVLRSVKALIKNSPKKWRPIINFLQLTLKQEASVDFKKFAIEIVEGIINDIPEARDQALLALADYIEDCIQVQIQLNVLNILNREVSKKQCPARVIRIINNRLHLEASEVRAAAVGVLGKFILHYPKERDGVKKLVQAAAQDPDEEVRNRALYYVGADAASVEPLQLNELDALEAYLTMNQKQILQSDDQNILSLKNALLFAEQNKGKIKRTEVPQQLIEQEVIQQQEYVEDNNYEVYKHLFKESQIFRNYGPLRQVSKQLDLTDKKSEYIVSVNKYLFDCHIVLEYKLKNTLEVTLQDVSAELTIKNPHIVVDTVVNANLIEQESTSNIFVGLAVNPDIRLVSSTIQTIFHFKVKDNNALYDDEFQVEDFVIAYSEYLKPDIWFKSFKTEWEKQAQPESVSIFQLDYKNTDVAIKELVRHFGLSVCESSDVVQPANKFHTLYLSGQFLGYLNVLITIQIGFQQNQCIVKLRCKCQDEKLSQLIIESLG